MQKCRELAVKRSAIKVGLFAGFSYLFLNVPLVVPVLLLIVVGDIYLASHRRDYSRKVFAAMVVVNFFIVSQVALVQVQAQMVAGGTYTDAGMYEAAHGAVAKNYYHNWVKFEYVARVKVDATGLQVTYSPISLMQTASARYYTASSGIFYPQSDNIPKSNLKTISASSGPTTLRINLTVSFVAGPTRFSCPMPSGAYVQQYVNPISTFYYPGALIESTKGSLAPLNGGKSQTWQTNIRAGQDMAIDIETIAYGFDPVIHGRGVGQLDYDFDQIQVTAQVYINGSLTTSTAGQGEQFHPEFNFWGWLIPSELWNILIMYFIMVACGILITFLVRRVAYFKLLTYMIIIWSGIGFLWWLLDAPSRIPDWLAWIKSVPLLGDLVYILTYLFAGVQYIIIIGFACVAIYFLSRIFTEVVGTFLEI